MTKLKQIRDDLKKQFVEREDAIDAVTACLAAGEHVVLLGAPGTGKTYLIEEVTARIEGASMFFQLLNKFSQLEDVFGPLKMSALTQDRWSRAFQGYAPDAEIVFYDEVFKANSAILNANLRLMNERQFVDDGVTLKVPLLTMFGASNELPDGEELNALYDRFLVRLVVDYIREPGNFVRLLTGDVGRPDTYTTITVEELHAFQAEVEKVTVPEVILDALRTLRDQLNKEGVVPGDRRWRAVVKLAKANAAIEGRDTIGQDDLAIIRHALWLQPIQVKPVERAVLAMANPNEREALELLDQVEEIRANVQALGGADNNTKSKQGVEYHTKLKNIRKKLEKLKTEAAAAGRSTTQVDRANSATVSTIQLVLTDVLGIQLDSE